jgi:hypothetical protein
MVRLPNLLQVLLVAAPAFAAPAPTTENHMAMSSASNTLEARDLMVGMMYAYQAKGCAEGEGGAQDRFAIYKDHIYGLGSRQSFSIEWQNTNFQSNCVG